MDHIGRSFRLLYESAVHNGGFAWNRRSSVDNRYYNSFGVCQCRQMQRVLIAIVENEGTGRNISVSEEDLFVKIKADRNVFRYTEVIA